VFRATGDNWQDLVFERFAEAVEVTAVPSPQRLVLRVCQFRR